MMEQEMEARRYLIRVLSLKAWQDMSPSLNLFADAWMQFTESVTAAVIPIIKSFGEWYVSLPDDVRQEIEQPHT